MNVFEQALEASMKDVAALDVGGLVPSMLAAALLGTALATRPWRLLTRQSLPPWQMIQAQILLCAAAAVITAVIGNSLAKAFGLVGLGGFVRFRSGLKDPRDAAILFLLIGLGMACGHNALGLALVGGIFVGLLLFVLDLFNLGRAEPPQVTLAAETQDPAGTEVALRRALGTRKNVVVKRTALDFPRNRLEMDVEGLRPEHLTELLARGGDDGRLQGIRWTMSAREPERRVKEQEP